MSIGTAHIDGHRPDDADGGIDRSNWSWPVRGAELQQLLIAFVGVVGTFTLIGFVLTDWTAPNPVTRADDRAIEFFAADRTATLEDATHWGAFPAETIVKIALSTVICLVFLWLWRRWDEVVYVALPLIFEASAFIVVTWIVSRPRPDVERLLDSPVNSSFPSGHVAAATVYGAVAIVAAAHARSKGVQIVAWAVVVAIVVGVGWARMYQGMHFPSDVVAGVLLGITSLVVTHRVLAGAGVRPGGPGEERRR